MENKMRIFLVIVTLILTGCSTVRGYGQSSSKDITDICVIENPAVSITTFEADLIHQLKLRGVNVNVVRDKSHCKASNTLTYSARRSTGVLTKIDLGLYENDYRIAYIDWDAGRGPFPTKVPKNTLKSVEYWQIAEALAGLFGEIEIK